MYKHVVLWKLKDEGDGMPKAKLAGEVATRLDTLPGIASEISDYEVAIDIGDHGAPFRDVSLIAVYPDEEAVRSNCAYPKRDAALASSR